MYEKKSIKSEHGKSFSKRNDSANKHALNKNKETSSCNSCGVCSRLRSPQQTHKGISSALSYAKAVGKGSCAVSFMQSNYGNCFTANILSPTIQKKCSCGGTCARCKGEEEAERVSRSIMKKESGQSSAISFKPTADSSGQTKISEIMSNKSSGQSLDENTRSFLEPKFGFDFRHVRIHTDSYAARKSNELNAEAFTIGRDVFFNTGRYKPSSIEGKKLLAHELVHVVQQSRGNTTINCWGHKDHIKITETAAKGIITDGFFMFHLLGQVNTMDYMERRLVKVAIPAAKKEIFGTIYSEGAEHGEGGDYKDTSENTAAKKNIDLQNLRFNKALSYHQSSILLIKKGVPVHKVGEVSEKLFVSLGDACHIAQDRGSHREGTKGMGHDDQREKEEWWRADNPRDNGPGYEKAIENTKQLLTQWVTKRREIDKE